MPFPSTSTAEPAQRQIELRGEPPLTIDYAVRRRRGARSIRLYVGDDGAITVSAPPRVALRELDRVVLDRSDWLRSTVSTASAAADQTRVDLTAGDPVPLHGVPVETRLVSAGRGVRLTRDRATWQPCLEIPGIGDERSFAQLVAWYREHARTVFTDRVTHHAALLGLRPGRISIRDQRTRWGSCTARADLSFNWRLVLAPEWVLDAIVVHELTHIDHLDHSPRFWALLEDRCPEHRAAQAWLRAHGRSLYVRRAEPRAALTLF